MTPLTLMTKIRLEVEMLDLTLKKFKFSIPDPDPQKWPSMLISHFYYLTETRV
jgi:hypothetical protein